MKKKASKKMKKSSKNKSSFSFNGKYLLITLAFALTSSAILGPVFAARGGKNSAPPAYGLYMLSGVNKVKNGGTVTVEVRANSTETTTNAVQAELVYPTDKLEFVSIDYTGSAYTIEAEETASNGLIKVVRAANPAVAGDNRVATVTFRAIASNGKADISSSTSVLLDSDTNTNIASDNRALSFRLSR